MKSIVLRSDDWYFLVETDKEVLSYVFKEEIQKADQLKISVSCITYDALKELERLVEKFKIKKVSITFGLF